MTIKTKRCNKCLKKTLFLTECKCNEEFCLNCLPYFNHSCSFKWKENKRDVLIGENPKIMATKIITI